MLTFEHRSNRKPPAQLVDKVQFEGGKPRGLWMSYVGKWAEWTKDPHKWMGCMNVPEQQIHYYPWGANIPPNAVIGLEINNYVQLDAFINKYRLIGSTYNINWITVAQDYKGVLFYNTKDVCAVYKDMPFSKQSDGCWILSIDVDSLCLWSTDAMHPIHWQKVKKRKVNK